MHIVKRAGQSRPSPRVWPVLPVFISTGLRYIRDLHVASCRRKWLFDENVLLHLKHRCLLLIFSVMATVFSTESVWAWRADGISPMCLKWMVCERTESERDSSFRPMAHRLSCQPGLIIIKFYRGYSSILRLSR